jgi:hypothetical protein
MKTILLFVGILLAKNTQAQPVSEYWAQKVEAETLVLEDVIKRRSSENYLYNVLDQKGRLAEAFELYQKSASSQSAFCQTTVDSSKNKESSWSNDALVWFSCLELTIYMGNVVDHDQTQEDLLKFLSDFKLSWRKMREGSNYTNVKQ